MNIRKKRRISVIVIGIIVGGLVLLTPISASDARLEEIVPCDVMDCNATKTYRAVDKKKVGSSYGSWIMMVSNVSGAKRDGETLKGGKTISVSNSVSGAVSASYNAISSSIGANVTKTRSVSTSYSVTLKKGEKAKIYVRPIYTVYSGNTQQWYSGTIGCNFWGPKKAYKAKIYSAVDYKADVWK